MDSRRVAKTGAISLNLLMEKSSRLFVEQVSNVQSNSVYEIYCIVFLVGYILLYPITLWGEPFFQELTAYTNHAVNKCYSESRCYTNRQQSERKTSS